eukprot:7840-Heterococcus_DN1.PRE.3
MYCDVVCVFNAAMHNKQLNSHCVVAFVSQDRLLHSLQKAVIYTAMLNLARHCRPCTIQHLLLVVILVVAATCHSCNAALR